LTLVNDFQPSHGTASASAALLVYLTFSSAVALIAYLLFGSQGLNASVELQVVRGLQSVPAGLASLPASLAVSVACWYLIARLSFARAKRQ
jgi:hypothetical protein